MVREFKFLQTKQKAQLFQFEITNDITKRGNIIWSREYSDAVRRWVSDLYFNDLYRNPNYHMTYIQSIDRTCELIGTPTIIDRVNHCQLFSVTVKIWGRNKWLIAKLSYPIEHIIYR